MAEIAIPLIALGSMYVISKQKKGNNNSNSLKSDIEGYSNMAQTRNLLPGINPPTPVNNFPLTDPVTINNNMNAYINPNQYSDKYYDPKNYAANEKKQPSNYGVGGGIQSTYSMTGAPIDKTKFKHNNMMPYFGGKVRGSTADTNLTESVLDNMQGQGSQYFSKKEQGPMFKPEGGYQFADGTPNMSDFYQSRVNPSMRMANVKPWDEQHVAPGLNKGFTNDGSAGFNSGMESRELWLDRGVDELRVATNPKTSYELAGHQGPGTFYIQNAPTTAMQGKVEKKLPEKYYASGPERWLTTTGIEKAQTARSIEELRDVNRIDTTAEYYGSRGNLSEGTYINGENAPVKRPVLPAKDYATPSFIGGSAKPTTGDYGIQSYSNLHNNRSTTRTDASTGHASGFMKAIVSPLMDFLRPTRKEDVVDNMRSSGNAAYPVPTGKIYNPLDRTKTTIREMTEAELDCNHMNVQFQSGNAYLVSEQQPVGMQRDTTNKEHTGMAGPNGFAYPKSYEAEYRQRNNVNKTQESRPNQGGTQIFNQTDNITIHKRDDDRNNNRWWVPSSGNTAGVTSRGVLENLDRVKVSQGYDQNVNTDRIAPDILNAFKSNPYTQSLSSWA
jgi:hypothetical protein